MNIGEINRLWESIYFNGIKNFNMSPCKNNYKFSRNFLFTNLLPNHNKRRYAEFEIVSSFNGYRCSVEHALNEAFYITLSGIVDVIKSYAKEIILPTPIHDYRTYTSDPLFLQTIESKDTNDNFKVLYEEKVKYIILPAYAQRWSLMMNTITCGGTRSIDPSLVLVDYNNKDMNKVFVIPENYIISVLVSWFSERTAGGRTLIRLVEPEVEINNMFDPLEDDDDDF